jgi:hypothetical protein
LVNRDTIYEKSNRWKILNGGQFSRRQARAAMGFGPFDGIFQKLPHTRDFGFVEIAVLFRDF